MNKGVFFKKGNVNNTVLQNKDQVKESEENKNINKFIEAYPHFKTENFFLFISLSTPLKLDFKPLVG